MTLEITGRQATAADEDEEELVRLTNITTAAVGLVDRAANRWPFVAIKRAGDPACKQAPTAEMSNEQLRAAREARAAEYGIEVLEGGALSFPADYPTSLDEYGDPVNLAYPVDTPDRARNARVRFKQNFSTYAESASRDVVHERIVRAELRHGVSPSYDPDDPLDAALPAELREQLLGTAQKQEQSMEPKEIVEALLNGFEAGQTITAEQVAQLEQLRDALGDRPAEPAPLPSDAEVESQEMAAEGLAAVKSSNDARQMARQILYGVLDAIERGEFDSEEDRAVRSQIIETLRARVTEAVAEQKLGPPLPVAESAAKAGQPQFSKARVAALKEAAQGLDALKAQLKALLDEIGALAEAAMEPAGEGAQKSAGPTAEELESLKAQLAVKDGEVLSLKADNAALVRRAAPSLLMGTEGRVGKPEPQEPKPETNAFDFNANLEARERQYGLRK